MIRSWILHIPFFVLFVFIAPVPAFAQSDEEAAAEAARAAAEQAQRDAEAQASQAMMARGQAELQTFIDGIRPPDAPLNPDADREQKFLEFRQAIPKIRAAIKTYRVQLNSAGKLDKPRKDIESEANVMLHYLSAAKVKHPPVDPLEFKGTPQIELEREILKSAERVASQADAAVRAERQNTVSAKTLDFLYKFDGELLRLKWLTSHVK